MRIRQWKVLVSVLIVITLLPVVLGAPIADKYHKEFGGPEYVLKKLPPLKNGAFLVAIPPDGSGVEQYLIFTPNGDPRTSIINGHRLITNSYAVNLILITDNPANFPDNVEYTLHIENPLKTTKIFIEVNLHSLFSAQKGVKITENTGRTYYAIVANTYGYYSDLPENNITITLNNRVVGPYYDYVGLIKEIRLDAITALNSPLRARLLQQLEFYGKIFLALSLVLSAVICFSPLLKAERKWLWIIAGVTVLAPIFILEVILQAGGAYFVIGALIQSFAIFFRVVSD